MLGARQNEYSPFVAVDINGIQIVAMLDSGNTYANVISSSLCKRLGLTDEDLRATEHQQIGTAKSGVNLRVLGQTKNSIPLRILGINHTFRIKPVIIKNLSMDLNICGPFLHKHGIDQLHAERCIEYKGQKVTFAQLVKEKTSDKTVLYVKEKVIVPPRSICFISLRAADQAAVRGEGLVEGSGEFMERSDLHPWVAALATWTKDGTIIGGVMNTTESAIQIPANIRYGSFTNHVSEEEWLQNPEGGNICTLSNRTSKDFRSQESSVAPVGPTWTRTAKAKWLRDNCKLSESPFLHDQKDEKRVVDLLIENWEAFSIEGEYGFTTLIEHEIHTSAGPPIKQKYRPPNPALEEDLKVRLKDWQDRGVIEPSQSPWSFSLVAVPKKNGKIRWCVDYRALNARTLRDQYPLPSINDNLNKLAKSRIFTGIDGCGAYHVINVAKRDRHKTAFATPQGSFQFARLPFGLTNAPATYSRLVQMVLDGIPYSMALPYIDDCCIHAADLDSHLIALDRVLKAYITAGLKLQPPKCQWLKAEIEYLGHMISKSGITPVPKYLRVVKDWPIPTTRTEARAFLGKVGYYQRFIQNYSALARSWMEVTGKADKDTERKPLEVTKEMEEAFQILKTCLLSAPILAYPRFDSKEPFILDTDWSQDNATIGAVLSQKQEGQERVICYGSKKLSKGRANYAPTKGELYGVIFFVQHFSYFLRFKPFVLRTDHSSLKWIHSLEQPSGMIERWLQTLANFHFTVEHRPGKQHGNADALSRVSHGDPPDPDSGDEGEGLPATQLMAAIAVLSSTHPWSREEIKEAQINDEDLRAVMDWTTLKKNPSKLEMKALSAAGQAWCVFLPQLYISRDGLLHRKPPPKEALPHPGSQLCLPKILYDKAVGLVHAGGGHMGRDATLARLQRNLFFPNMKRTVEDFLLRCQNCQAKLKSIKEQRHTLISQLEGFPFQKLSIDFVGPLRASHRGNIYLFTVKCTFTKWLEGFPVRDATAEEVVRILETEIFARFGFPEQLHSDMGSQFTSELFTAVGNLLGLRISTTPAYNPKSNPVERSHRDLGTILRALIAHSERSWEQVLPQALFALRTTPSRSTGLTPFQMMFGRDAAQPLDLIFGGPEKQLSFKGRKAGMYVQDLKERIQTAHEYARTNLTKAVRRQRRQYCKEKQEFQVGSKVYLFTPKTKLGESRKLTNFWTGPWTIIAKPSELLYTLRPDPSWQSLTDYITVSIDRLKPYHGPDPYNNHEPLPDDDIWMEGDEMAETIDVAPQASGGMGPAPSAPNPPRALRRPLVPRPSGFTPSPSSSSSAPSSSPPQGGASMIPSPTPATRSPRLRSSSEHSAQHSGIVSVPNSRSSSVRRSRSTSPTARRSPTANTAASPTPGPSSGVPTTPTPSPNAFSPPARFSPVPLPPTGVRGPFTPRGALGGTSFRPWGWDYYDLGGAQRTSVPTSVIPLPFQDDQKDKTFQPVSDRSSSRSNSRTSSSENDQGGGEEQTQNLAAGEMADAATATAAAAEAAAEFDPLAPRSPVAPSRPKRKAAAEAEKKVSAWGKSLEMDDDEFLGVVPNNSPNNTPEAQEEGAEEKVVEEAAKRLVEQQEEEEEELRREEETAFEQQMHGRSRLMPRTP